MAGDSNSNSFLDLTAELVSAYVSNNPVPTNELAALIGQVHNTLSGLSAGTMFAVPTPQTPAVSIKKSVTPDYIVCLEDGKKFKSLKRHLGVHFNMTPDEYRAKWNLPADYPMVAPNYAATRSALAKKIGLGRKSAEPVKRGRKTAA